MGNPSSKLQSDKKLNTSISKDDNEVNEQSRLDPRSPTADISRTPVQLRSPNKCTHQTITKQQNLNDTLSTPTKVQTKGMLNTLLRGRLGANLELRSPSANIDRTPIMLDKTIDSKSKIVLEGITDSFSALGLEPKNLSQDDSELECSIIKTANHENDDCCVKLDEVAQYADEYINSDDKNSVADVSAKTRLSVLSNGLEKRKSYLETNMDCLETDLDKVKTLPKLRKPDYNTPKSAPYESPKELFDPRSPTGEFCRTPIAPLSAREQEFTPVSENKVIIINELGDPRSATKEIFRTPILLPNDSVTVIPESLNKPTCEENILNLSINEEETGVKLALKSSKLEEIRKDFAKKYGKNIKSDPVNQIYEDTEFLKVTPRKALSASGDRTPLSCIRNKSVHYRSKSDDTKNKKLDTKLTHTNDLQNVRTPLSCVRNTNGQPRSGNTLLDSKKSETRLINNLSNVATRSISKQAAVISSHGKKFKNFSRIPTLRQKTTNSVSIESLRSSDSENMSLQEQQLQIPMPDGWDKDSSVVI